MNTEILSTGGDPVQYDKLTPNNYRNAMVSANVAGTVNPVLTTAISKIEAKGATAANYGLAMANNIFGAIDSTGRQRIIIFLTDGEPTSYSNYEENVANDAISKANFAKETYGAIIYGIGVDCETANAKKFISRVSSNYMNVTSMRENASAVSDKFYMSVTDTSRLNDVFVSIAEASTTYYSDFNNITLIDTVSRYFTLTTEQEKQLIINAAEMLGVDSSHVSITRNADGTTTIRIDGIDPVQVNENGKIKYVASFEFKVSANERTTNAGSYATNTEDAGVILDGAENYEDMFTPQSVTLTAGRGVVIFNVDGKPFHIATVKPGDKVKAPAYSVQSGCVFSGWDMPESFVYEGETVVFNATVTGTHTTHEYDTTATVKEKNCLEDGIVEHFCACGHSYTETIPATGDHTWVAIRGLSAAEDLATECFRCSVCGELMEKAIEYKIEATVRTKNGRIRTITETINLKDASGNYSQPDDTVTITVSTADYFDSYVSNIKVYRIEGDRKIELPATYNGSFVSFETDHFSTYVFEAVYECEETGEHIDEDEDFVCDICDSEIPQPSPWDEFRCKMCDTYELMKDKPVVGILYTIIHFFVHLAHFIGFIT